MNTRNPVPFFQMDYAHVEKWVKQNLTRGCLIVIDYFQENKVMEKDCWYKLHNDLRNAVEIVDDIYTSREARIVVRLLQLDIKSFSEFLNDHVRYVTIFPEAV